MINRMQSILPEQACSAGRENVNRQREPLQNAYDSLKGWALDHPLESLATVFSLGAMVAWLVKRR
jgi:hypothetical protein